MQLLVTVLGLPGQGSRSIGNLQCDGSALRTCLSVLRSVKQVSGACLPFQLLIPVTIGCPDEPEGDSKGRPRIMAESGILTSGGVMGVNGVTVSSCDRQGPKGRAVVCYLRSSKWPG